MTKASVAGCPNIGWRLARHDDGTITGISYYADASGARSATPRGFDCAKGDRVARRRYDQPPIGETRSQWTMTLSHCRGRKVRPQSPAVTLT
jgi:hypothetical protein